MMKLFAQSAKQSHALHVAFAFVFVFILIMSVGCGYNGRANDSETAKFEEYSIAIQQAQDSGNYQKAVQLNKELYDMSQKSHSYLLKAQAASSYAQILMLTGQAEEGKQIIDEVMKHSDAFSEDTVMGNIYDTYGIYEMTKGQNVYAATEYFLKALGYVQQRKDKLVLSGALANVASSMTNQHDTTGLKYALESYQIAKAIDKPFHQAYAAVNVIMQMKFRKDFDGAQKWLDTLRLLTTPSFMEITANTLQADISRETNDLEKASRFIDLAVAAVDTSAVLQPMEKENAYLGKANVLCFQGRCEESNQWLKKLEELSKQSGLSIPEAEVAKVYAMNYEKLGDYKKALEYRNKQKTIKENNTNSDRIKIQKAKEVALDIAQKDAEIEQQREHARMLKWLLWGAIGFCVLLAGLCLYIYDMYKRRRTLMSLVVNRAQPDKEIEKEKEKEEENKKKSDERYVELFQRIKHEIEDNKKYLDTSLSRESLADELGVNRSYFTEAVAQMTGMNFPQYINRLRVNEAERQLHDPQVDVSNFANFGRSIGFASLTAFRTAFKQQTGMTPSTYRELARAKVG